MYESDRLILLIQKSLWTAADKEVIEIMLYKMNKPKSALLKFLKTSKQFGFCMMGGQGVLLKPPLMMHSFIEGKTFIHARNIESWGKTGIIKFIMRSFGKVLRFGFGSKRSTQEVRKQLQGLLVSQKKDLDRLADVTENEMGFLVSLKLTWDYREIKQMVQEELKRMDVKFEIKLESFQQEKNEGSMNDIKKIILVASCKGGVGKSTLALELAKSTQKLGLKVGLFDADFYGPSLPVLIDQVGVSAWADESNPQQPLPIEFKGIKTMSFGFVNTKEKSLLKGPIVSSLISHLIKNTLWGQLDVLFIDTPPGTGDINIKLSQELKSCGTVLVTTPHHLSYSDVIKGMDLFQQLEIPILGMIENMSSFYCPCCTKQSQIFGHSKVNQMRNQFGIEHSLNVPIFNETQKDQKETFFQGDFFTQFTYKLLRECDQQLKNKYRFQQEFLQDKNLIKITWQNEHFEETKEFNPRELRLKCKCALCVDELTNKNLIQQDKIPLDIKPLKLIPKGNTALAITWSDGHRSSVYPYKFLFD